MALQVSGAGLGLFNRRSGLRIRAVASESVTTLRGESEKVKLGGSDVKVTQLGIGAWSWDDTSYWNDSQWDGEKVLNEFITSQICDLPQDNHTLYQPNIISSRQLKAAFDASIDGGVSLFDTAEVYGAGIMMGAVNSETLLGDFIKERKKTDSVEVAVATKFAALPWRFGRVVVSALKASLSRLGLSSVDLDQLHWPGFWGNEGYIDGPGDVFKRAYNEKQLRDAYDQLKRGIPFAANQVQYSLIYRNPEENGVKAAFDELGITLIACSPMAQGILTGKYTPKRPPTGPRSKAYTPEYLTKLQPLMTRIKEIAQNYSKSPT